LFAAIGTQQVAWLTTAQIDALTTAQIAALDSADLPALSTDQLAGFAQSQDIVALSTAQFQAFGSAQIAALSTLQVQWLETADIAAFTPAQVPGLTTAQIPALSTDQVAAFDDGILQDMTMAQSDAFTTEQRDALSPPQYAKLTFSPLVLDLDGDGVETLGVDRGVEFDLAGLGRPHPTGWVAPDDGLLVLDRNANGRIDDGSELFGTSTRRADGSLAADGFDALAGLDTDGDRRITAADAGFVRLQVWVDADVDGQTDTGELRGLVDLGIVELRLDAVATDRREHDNLIGLVADYTPADGLRLELADVWFRARAPQDTPPPSAEEVLAGPAAPLLSTTAADTTAAPPAPADTAGTSPPPPATGSDEDWLQQQGPLV